MVNYCSNCGIEVDSSWKTCTTCGTSLKQEPISQPPIQPPIQQLPKSKKTYGKQALICGLIGCICFSFILGPLAIYFGNKGLKEDEDKTFATIGIILGIIDIICFVISIFIIIAAFS